jgi:hypothetical protein
VANARQTPPNFPTQRRSKYKSRFHVAGLSRSSRRKLQRRQRQRRSSVLQLGNNREQRRSSVLQLGNNREQRRSPRSTAGQQLRAAAQPRPTAGQQLGAAAQPRSTGDQQSGAAAQLGAWKLALAARLAWLEEAVWAKLEAIAAGNGVRSPSVREIIVVDGLGARRAGGSW